MAAPKIKKAATPAAKAEALSPSEEQAVSLSASAGAADATTNRPHAGVGSDIRTDNAPTGKDQWPHGASVDSMLGYRDSEGSL